MANILSKGNTTASLLLDEGEQLYKEDTSESYDLADDNGYAYHKIAAWVVDSHGNKRIKTASIASRAQLGKVNVVPTGSSFSVGLFEIDGEYYTVGENVPDPESIRSKSYCYSEVNNVLVTNSVYQAGLAGKSIRLATGLPLKQYFNNDGELNTKTIKRVQDSIQPLANAVGNSESVQIDKHIIYAESLSAFVDWMVDDTGEIINQVNNGVLVVDVGGGTTDISFINPMNEIYMPGSDTVKTGVLDVFKKLKQLLSSEYDIDEEHIRDDMLDKAIRTNRFNARGDEKDCSTLVNKAKRHVAKRLNNFIDELVSSTLDNIIFVGGGAQALREQLLNLDDHAEGFVVIPNEPQYANVRGMLKCMTYIDNE
ncbi:plasmid segregation protein ParM domain-containing protein [Pseudoalteromonas nigrifaciens]|uniref:plasmid segregation protein ParM domain-containing protein n=1 Tax=Pseudoalteromonas nigrifaciens TaxID=28109 RepID=UPI003FD07A57